MLPLRSRLSALLWCVPVALAGFLLLPLWLAFGAQWAVVSTVRRFAAAAHRPVPFGLVKWRRTARRLSWLIAAIAVALLAAGTVVAGVVLSGSYSATTDRLTAWAVILAGATLIVAIVGLPVALYQLATVRQDLDRVTRAGDFERDLNDLMLPGVDLLERFYEQDDDDLRTMMTGWIEVVAQYIRDKTSNEIEEKLFRLEGRELQPRNQLERKIVHLRDKLIPKIRAGYW